MYPPQATTPKYTPTFFRALGFALRSLAFLLAVATGIPLSANERIDAAPSNLTEAGLPNFVIYNAETLGIQGAPSDIHCLPDGRILVVGQHDLSFGDGIRWELHRQADGLKDFIPQQLAIDEDSRLIAPVQDGFAEIQFREDGRWDYTKPTIIKEIASRSMATFVNIAHVNGHWYWHSTSGAIVQWDLKGTPKLLGSVNAIDYLFGLQGSLYISDLSNGTLTRYSETNAIFETISPPSAEGIANTICSSTPLSDNQLIIGTNTRGVQIFDGTTRTPLALDGPLAGGHRINYLCQTIGGFYAAAVDSLGIVFFNRNGRILQILSKQTDHRLGRVHKLINSGDGLIWALLNDGIARIEFPSKLSAFDSVLESGMSFIQPARFDGKLWLHADGKLMEGTYSPDGRLAGFEPNSPPAPFVFTLSTKTGHLFAPCDHGIYELTGTGWKLAIPDVSNARILTRSEKDGRWLYAAIGEIGWIDLSTTPYQLQRIRVPALSMNYGACLDDAGHLWLELGSCMVARIPSLTGPLSLEFFDTRNGIPDGWAALTLIDGKIRMNCANRVMRFDETTRQFSDDTDLINQYPEFKQSGGRALIDTRGGLWIAPTEKVRIIHNYQSKSKRWVETLPDGFIPFNFYDDASGVVWMHDRRRFLRYDPDMPQAAPQPLKAIITQVKLPGSNRTLFMPGGFLPDLPFSDNTISVNFLAPGNSFGQHVSFEFLLEGQQDHWISTGIVGSALFNGLKEGSYTLRIRPMVNNLPGQESRLSFVIRPPWFRTRLAYVAFGLLALLIIAAAATLPVYIERRHKTNLERIVAERTHELHDTNLLLARQVKETLQKAVELKASEERFRKLNTELEKRVDERTNELKRQVEAFENLNRELLQSQQEISRSAARLQEVNASLLVANHELESFSYTVSHDLRAPLRNVTGFIELLRKRLSTTSDKESERYLDIIISEARRMGTLIDDLLTFARIGRSEMKLRSVDILELVEQTKNEMVHDIQGRSITWKTQPMPRVLADQNLLRQVIANLLGNALKFTRTQTEAVIEIGCMPGSADMLTFFVRDNGVGFNPQYIDKLFRVFQRLHTTKDFEGTGIGLANVKRIITRHGGRVWAEGSINGGATFYFTLKPDSAPPPPPRSPSETKS